MTWLLQGRLADGIILSNHVIGRLDPAELGGERRPRFGKAEVRPLLSPAGAMLPAAQRYLQRRKAARRHHLGPCLHRGRRTVDGHWPRRGLEAARSETRRVLERHDARVAAAQPGPRIPDPAVREGLKERGKQFFRRRQAPRWQGSRTRPIWSPRPALPAAS